MADRPSTDTPLAERLARRGHEQLIAWNPALTLGDPEDLISPAARLLCCGLAELAHTAAVSLAPDAPPERIASVTRAAAGLALLTKLDDEVIDSPGFHGGPTTPRRLLRARTRTFLAPTLAAVCSGTAPEGAAPRVVLAAEVGRQLRACSAAPDALHALHDLIRRGWDIQVEAVLTLSAVPGSVSRSDLARVTAGISGAWLAMITAVGALAAGRALSADEEAAFFAWGRYIQSADALADLDKDLGDAFAATLPLGLALAVEPALLDAWRAGDGRALRRGLVRTGADRQVLPDVDTLVDLDRRLAALGHVPALLRWIHGFLLGRYLAATPTARARAFAPFVPDWRAFAASHAPTPSPREPACSA